jgi:hypothetical protein
MAEFRNPLLELMQQIKLTREGGLELPVKANGKDGIVVGDPPMFMTPPLPDAAPRQPGRLARLLRRLTRR